MLDFSEGVFIGRRVETELISLVWNSIAVKISVDTRYSRGRARSRVGEEVGLHSEEFGS